MEKEATVTLLLPIFPAPLPHLLVAKGDVGKGV